MFWSLHSASQKKTGKLDSIPSFPKRIKESINLISHNYSSTFVWEVWSFRYVVTDDYFRIYVILAPSFHNAVGTWPVVSLLGVQAEAIEFIPVASNKINPKLKWELFWQVLHKTFWLVVMRSGIRKTYHTKTDEFYCTWHNNIICYR